MSATESGRVCEQCGRAFTAGKSWSKFCSSACKVRAFRARNRSESDLERLLSAALDAVRRGNADGPALTALRRALVAALPPEEQPAPPPATVAEQPEQSAPTKQPALFGEELAAVADKAGDLSSQVAARLRRARENKVRFAELAREVDLADHSQLSRLAAGKGSISAKRLAALDAALSRRGF